MHIFICNIMFQTKVYTDSAVLWEQEKLPKEENPSWTELFSKSYKLIPLETNDDCFIGQIDKIKKFKNCPDTLI